MSSSMRGTFLSLQDKIVAIINVCALSFYYFYVIYWILSFLLALMQLRWIKSFVSKIG